MSEKDLPSSRPVNGAQGQLAQPKRVGQESKAAQEAKAARQAAAKSLTALPPWRQGVKTALVRFGSFAGVVLIWCVLQASGIVPTGVSIPITLALSVIVFLLSIPTGLLFRMDNMMSWGGTFGETGNMIVGLLVVLVNFILIGAVRGFLSGAFTGGAEAKGSQPGTKKN